MSLQENEMRAAFESAYSSNVLHRNQNNTYQIAGVQKEYEIFIRGWKAQAKVLYDQLNAQILKHESVAYSMGASLDPEKFTGMFEWVPKVAPPMLVQPSVPITPLVTIRNRSVKDILLGRGGIVDTFAGRSTWSTAIIDFGPLTLVTLNKQIKIMQFGDSMYHGIVPIRHEAGTNKYECAIDYIETKEQ